jgi:PAS domain S-box-containing protein
MKMVKALESSEERFRKIIHLTPNIAIQIFDSSGRIIDWNKASESMYKYTKKEVVGKTFGEVIFKDESQNQRFLNQLKTIKNSGKAFDPKEYMVYDKNQNEIYILSTTYPLPSDKDSEINEFICMDVDISELKKTQLELEKSKQALIIKNEKLLQAKEKIEVADRLKMSFLANVSHEIRTPMNAIIGFSQLLLLNDVSEEERLEYADYILKRSNDLLQLINDILDVSRIESGEMPLNPKFFQISNLLSHIFENYSMKSRFTNKSIEVKLDIEENLLEEKCYQDEERLKQILVNLLENAFKFTEKGSIEIACKKYENDSIDFIVRDTGIGISKDKINQIFNPFVQADSNHATRKYGGTGLGLSIVKGLCELIQGEIIVESEINKGSVFKIRVPQMLSLLKNE